MKFCGNCGKVLKDNAAFCPACGTKLAQSTVAVQPTTIEPVAYQYPAVPQQPSESSSKKGKKGMLIALISCIAVAVIAVVALLVILGGKNSNNEQAIAGGDSYQDVLNYQLDMYNGKFDYDNIELIAPKEAWEKVEREGKNKKDIANLYHSQMEAVRERIKYVCGDDVEATAHNITTTDFSATEKEKVYNAFEQKYGISRSSVEEILELQFDLQLKGSKNTDYSENMGMYVIKINGRWWSFSFLNDNVSFIIDGDGIQ